MVKERIALIDGDVIVYAAAWAAEEPIDWDDGTYTLECDQAKVADIIDSLVCDVESYVQPDQTVICLSDPKKVFRDDLYPLYKANRRGEGKRKPIGYRGARAHFDDAFEVLCRPNLEADDVMGIVATGGSKKYRAAEHVICSPDKDMRQVPGLHFNWQRSAEGVFEVGERGAMWKFWEQVLTGDSTDNIRGIPGVGPVKAGMLLENYEADTEGEIPNIWEDVVLPAYDRAGLGEEDALLTARLVKILQREDYDFKKKEPILWTPSAS